MQYTIQAVAGIVGEPGLTIDRVVHVHGIYCVLWRTLGYNSCNVAPGIIIVY